MRPAFQVPVGPLRQALPAPDQHVGGLQLLQPGEHALPGGPGGGDAQQLPPGVLVGPGGEAWVLEQGLGLGAKDEGSVHQGIEKGLDAEPVPAADQPPPEAVPKGEGIDALQMLAHLRPVFHAGAEQHLGVRVGVEAIALGPELRPQRVGVVQLPVVAQRVPGAAQGALHGLPAVLRINHRQPPVGQHTVFSLPKALIVGPAAEQGVRHPAAHVPPFRCGVISGKIAKSRNSAHHETSLCSPARAPPRSGSADRGRRRAA